MGSYDPLTEELRDAIERLRLDVAAIRAQLRVAVEDCRREQEQARQLRDALRRETGERPASP
jgi:predicted  nucleic acid-binding Zn-ribbon protein